MIRGLRILAVTFLMAIAVCALLVFVFPPALLAHWIAGHRPQTLGDVMRIFLEV